MRKYINVIDLDKTLIPYDSYRLLLKQEISEFDLFIICLTFKRVIRLISVEDFKKKTFQYLYKKYKSEFFRRFSNLLFHDLNEIVLSIITKETNENTLNIILSASPNFYIKYLIQKLNWSGSGSYFDKRGVFIHLYGKEKINWILKNYGKEEYIYNFAISDSHVDKELLLLFKKHILWKF